MSSLDQSKWINENTLNHRCPYCGDSQKNKYKSRAYHFVKENSFIFKCHNCGKTTSSVNFLKDNFAIQHKEYLKEWLQEKGQKPKQKMPSSNTFKFTPKVPRQTDSLNTNDENLKAVAVPVTEKAIARDYLLQRKITKEMMKDLWYVDNAQSLSFLSTKYRDRVLGNDPRIILPFYNENGKLIGISGRAINKSPLRYLTMRFEEETPLIFNLNKVDKTKTIYVTEGPIDSLFLPNSIAVAGSDFKKISEEIKECAILIYDNEPRNKEIIKKIEEVIDLGYRVCVWNDNRISDCKDINDMVMNGLTETEIVDIIDKCAVSGLSAKLQLKEFKRV